MLWFPEADETESSLTVDASPVFRVPVLVSTTRSEMRRMVQRLRAESKEELVSMSNRRFRDCISANATEMEERGGEEWGRFCGDVLVFYAIRYVLDGVGVPIRNA